MAEILELYLFKTLVFPKKKSVKFVKTSVLTKLPKRILPFASDTTLDFHNVIFCYLDIDKKNTAFVGMDGNGCRFLNLETKEKLETESKFQSKRM